MLTFSLMKFSRCLDANLVEIPVEVETPDHHYYHVWIVIVSLLVMAEWTHSLP